MNAYMLPSYQLAADSEKRNGCGHSTPGHCRQPKDISSVVKDIMDSTAQRMEQQQGWTGSSNSSAAVASWPLTSAKRWQRAKQRT